MKNKTTHTSAGPLSVAVLAALLSILAFAGCSKKQQEAATEKVKDVYQDSKAAASNAWDSVKSYSFEKRSEFDASAKAMTASFDAEVSKLHADYSEATASASRKAAMAELKNAEADYKSKLSALGTATADTWDSAKQNVIASWDKLQASYYKAKSS